jgi:hydrogenase nickel incorporation protein HypB
VAGADLVVLTKTDLLPHVPFDLEVFRNDVRAQSARVPLLELSALHGQGVDDWLTWLHALKQRERPARPIRQSATEDPASPEWFFG